jgi:DNA-damage-inducible protein D
VNDVVPFQMPAQGTSPFDSTRRTRQDDGTEYWSARELQPILGYKNWRDFEDAIDRARVSCRNTGVDEREHFARALKTQKSRNQHGPIDVQVADIHLSRYACYLVAMNGDPRKPEIAAAQTYFAIQTRRAELGLVRDEVWKQERLDGKTVRRTFTDVLQEHDVRGSGFAMCTDAINKEVLGGTAGQFRKRLGLKKSEATRDHCTSGQLHKLAISEDVSAHRIDRDNVRGNTPCSGVCRKTAAEVSEAIERLFKS